MAATTTFPDVASMRQGIDRANRGFEEAMGRGDPAGAYEIGRAQLTLAGGQSAEAKYVVLWRQEDGRWRWHIDMWNMDG